jgi:hypothetical protein
MAVVTGVVEAQKENKRFQINGDWYGSFNAVPGVNVGDTVTLNWDYDKSGKYRNIKGGVNVVSGAPAGGNTPSGGGSSGGRELTIMRQNALAHATALVVASGVHDVWDAQSLVLRLAEGFTKYSSTGEFDDASGLSDAQPDF